MPLDSQVIALALRDAERGDVRALQRALERVPAPVVPALSTPLRLAGLIDGPLVPARAVPDGGGADIWSVFELALPALARACAIGFDRAGLARLTAALPAIAASGPGAGIVLAWAAIARGAFAEAAAEAEIAERTAAAAGQAAAVVDASAIRALALTESGALDDAVKIARRSSRMASTEELPQGEYLANLVLARVRRKTGRAYQAARILTSLLRFTPPPWHAWIQWELAMALGAADDAVAGPHRQLTAMLGAVDAADRGGFDDRCRALIGAVDSWRPLASDAALARAAIDSTAVVDGDEPAFATWRRGDIDEPPLGIDGLVADVEAGVACVVASPAMTPVRIVQRGGALAALTPGAVHLRRQRNKHGRTDSTLAVLGLAYPRAIEETVLFRAVYGFAFVRDLHANVLNVLLHRVRKRIGDAADLERDDGGIRLVPRTVVVVPDPRCSRSHHDRMLRYITQHDQVSARDAANAIGVPLRTAQAALEALLADGVCAQQRDGRNVSYRVEDTTFQVPTRWKLDS